MENLDLGTKETALIKNPEMAICVGCELITVDFKSRTIVSRVDLATESAQAFDGVENKFTFVK